MLEIASSLTSFQKADIFQSGIMSLISGLKASQEEIDDLDKMFKKFDKNHDGTLSLIELK